MPLRYAQEVMFLCHVRIIRKVLTKCEEAIGRVPIDTWPLFGGWELLDPASKERVPTAVDPEEAFEHEGDDRDSDDEDDAEVEDVEEPVVPMMPTAARRRGAPRSAAELPSGWSRVEQTLSSGRVIPHFYGPDGAYSRSIVGAWRQFHASAGSEMPREGMPSLGDALEVWWTEEERWLAAKVSKVDAIGSCAYLVYAVDGVERCHDLSAVSWRAAQAAGSGVAEEVANDGAAASASVEVPAEAGDVSAEADGESSRSAPDGGPEQQAVAPEAKGKRSFPAKVCGNPQCKLFRTEHFGEGLCQFVSPAKDGKRPRRSI